MRRAGWSSGRGTKNKFTAEARSHGDRRGENQNQVHRRDAESRDTAEKTKPGSPLRRGVVETGAEKSERKSNVRGLVLLCVFLRALRDFAVKCCDGVQSLLGYR